MSALEIMLEKAYDEGKKDAEAELKRTKRALWLARAERAKDKASLFSSGSKRAPIRFNAVLRRMRNEA